MPFVKNVHNGHHFHSPAVAVFRIYVILYRDKPYPESREYIIDVLPDLNIVPAETGQVFYYNRIDSARLCVVQQPLHFGALKGST